MVHGRSISVNVFGVACPVCAVKTRPGKTLNESKWNLEYLIHHFDELVDDQGDSILQICLMDNATQVPSIKPFPKTRTLVKSMPHYEPLHRVQMRLSPLPL